MDHSPEERAADLLPPPLFAHPTARLALLSRTICPADLYASQPTTSAAPGPTAGGSAGTPAPRRERRSRSASCNPTSPPAASPRLPTTPSAPPLRTGWTTGCPEGQPRRCARTRTCSSPSSPRSAPPGCGSSPPPPTSTPRSRTWPPPSVKHIRDGAGVGAVADWELQAVFGDQVLGGGFVVDRQGDDLGAKTGDAVQRPLKGSQLAVAARAPRAPVEQHHAEVASQSISSWRLPSPGSLTVTAGNGSPRHSTVI